MARKKSSQTPEEICEERISEAAKKASYILDLANLGLRDLPASVGQLTRLGILNISGNKLTKLPESIRQLPRLGALYAIGNELVALPQWLTKLRALERLVIGHNRLTALPEWIGQFARLVSLDVDHNELPSLPESIDQLSRLRRLDASHNGLSALPESLMRLERLQHLFLHDNPLLKLPPEVLGPTYFEVMQDPARSVSPASILDYYFRTRRAKQTLNEAKLILVGRGGVGKTSLVNRLLRDKFTPSQAKTEGIQISSWPLRLGNDDVRFHIWDFGGQEILHATHQFFLTQRSLYLLVLSGREGTEDQDADYWLRMVESFGAGSPVIVVLNKSKEHRFDVNRRALQLKYPAIRGFVATDCADRMGIPELLDLIMREADRLENLRAVFPTNWFGIKAALSASTRNYLSFAEFQRLCQQHGEQDDKAQEMLAGHLHQLGVALNYKDDPRLQDTHVLNPHWVTNGIYKLLASPVLTAQHGELGLGDVAKILSREEYPTVMHRFLLDLMKKFELCFTFPDNDARYLIPELLDKQEPAETAQFPPGECLNFQYHYPVLPEGLLPRFIVRTHALSERLPRWRTGVILQFEGNQALVKADPAEKRVFISVNGPVAGRRRLLAVIRSDFERIHRDIPKLEPQEMVPVPGHPEVVISYEELLAFEESQVFMLPKKIGNHVEKLNVRDLLNGVDLPTLAGDARSRSGKERLPAEPPVRLFYSYSHKDEPLRNRLEPHLKLLQRQGLLSTWHDRMISAGEEWKDVISTQLEQAEVILLLVSADFLASDYCYDVEMKAALERHDAGQAVVIPVMLRDVKWTKAPFAKLQALPKDGRAVTLWPNEDSAWRDVSEGIERTIEEIRKKRQLR